MEDFDKDEPGIGKSSGRNPVEDQPLRPDESKAKTPEDPLETDDGGEHINWIGDDESALGNNFEKPHLPTTPSAEYDGIRDGDRDANDEISGGEIDNA
jgi:hypothetical protein